MKAVCLTPGPAFEKQRQEEEELKATIYYTASWKLAQSSGDPVFKRRKITLQNSPRVPDSGLNGQGSLPSLEEKQESTAIHLLTVCPSASQAGLSDWAHTLSRLK